MDGVVTLPTIGQFDLREFVPAHRHRGVEIDDRTPYRRFSAPVPPHPLRPAELTAWRLDLDAAWEVLTRWHPRSATELAAGVSVITPLLDLVVLHTRAPAGVAPPDVPPVEFARWLVPR